MLLINANKQKASFKLQHLQIKEPNFYFLYHKDLNKTKKKQTNAEENI